jgi:CRISPR/Cas system-associated exonuclease Cas4 (RecB family)
MIAAIESPAVTVRARQPKTHNAVEELEKRVSASRLGLWQTCRLKFYFRYVLQLSKPQTPALHVGKVVHGVLQSWNMARWKKEPFAIDRFKKFFDGDWQARQKQDPIKWEGKEDKQRSGAWSLLEMYFAQTPIPIDEKPEAVEVPAEADLHAHGLPTLVGVIDLVRAGGRIVDFKTSGKTPDREQAAHYHETQLSCYSLLYRDATGKRESGLELHHLVKTKKPKLVVTSLPPMDQKRETRLFRAMESFVEGVRRKDFVPSRGFHCAGCEFLRECRAWSGGGNQYE